MDEGLLFLESSGTWKRKHLKVRDALKVSEGYGPYTARARHAPLPKRANRANKFPRNSAARSFFFFI